MNLDSIDNAIERQRFVEKIGQQQGRADIVAGLNTYVADQVLEEGFAGKILHRHNVSMADPFMRESEVSGVDLPQALFHVKPTATASKTIIGARPKGMIIRDTKFLIDFYQVATPLFQKNLTELKTISYPLKDLLTRDSILYMAKIEDQALITLANTAVSGSATRELTTAGAGSPIDTNNADNVPYREHFITAFNAVEGQQSGSKSYKVDKILMHQTLYNKCLSWKYNEQGPFMDELRNNGTLLERKVIVTTKDVINPNEIYLFPKEEYLGYFLVYEDVNHWVYVKKNMYEQYAWEVIGMGFGVNEGVVRAEFVK